MPATHPPKDPTTTTTGGGKREGRRGRARPGSWTLQEAAAFLRSLLSEGAPWGRLAGHGVRQDVGPDGSRKFGSDPPELAALISQDKTMEECVEPPSPGWATYCRVWLSRSSTWLAPGGDRVDLPWSHASRATYAIAEMGAA